MSKLLETHQDILPYEKCLMYGAGALTNEELLAVLIRTGTKDCSCLEIAHRIMCQQDGLGLLSLTRLGIKDFRSIEGIGLVKAVMLTCVGELSSRIAVAGIAPRRAFNDAGSIASCYMERMRHLDREQFMLLMLNSRCELIHESLMAIGTVSTACLSPREIFRDALSCDAVYIVMLHNHPSGDPSPSQPDIDTTTRVKEAGSIIGISLIDHIIIGDNRYVSFKENSIL